jgi:hypothetical protein
MSLHPTSPLTPPAQLNINGSHGYDCDWEHDGFKFRTAEDARVPRWSEMVAFAVAIISVEIDRVSAHRALGSAAEPAVEAAELFKVAARVMNMMQHPAGKNGEPADPKARLYTFSPPPDAPITEVLEIVVKLLNITANPKQYSNMAPEIQRYFKPVYQ